MRIPQAIEQAFCNALRNYALGDQTIVRCWHNLRHDPKWGALFDSTGEDLSLPDIQLICSQPEHEGSPTVVFKSYLIAQARTKAEEDRQHTEINLLGAAIQECAEALYAGWYKGTGTLWPQFVADVASEAPNLTLTQLVLGTPETGQTEEGYLSESITINVHFNRTDI